MKKYVSVILVTAFLLTSCTNNESQVAMKSFESNNELLQKQIEALEKENEILKKDKDALTLEISTLNDRMNEKNSEINNLESEIELLKKSKSFIIDNYEVDKRKITEVDLNNDGNKEFIKLECSREKYYKLSINDVSITGIAANLDYNFKIVDLNDKDNFKEIAVSELGNNNNPKTTFYRYGIDNIIYVGKVTEYIKNIKVNGDGSLIISENGNILCSWSYDDKYVLTSEHILVKEAKKFYDMNQKVKVLKSIPLLKSTTENEMVAALTVGEEAVLIASDNKRWCQVKKENGDCFLYKLWLIRLNLKIIL